MFHAGLMEVARRDKRYAYEAYEFLFEALAHTQKLLGRVAEPTQTELSVENPVENHVSGPELLTGVTDLARHEFGRMARVVFHFWGIDSTDDVGEIVFNLIDANLLSKTERDQRNDFHNLFDLDDMLLRNYEIRLEKTE
jgi:uncharacterized repeat protein (TIGR04138 family)